MNNMLKEKKLSIIGKIFLLMATIIWGSSFFILKNSLEELPTFYVLAIRFTIGAVMIFFMFFKKMLKITKTAILQGIILGLFLVTAYIVQTYGLINTTPSKNAFLTSTYCIIVPILLWLFFKKKPSVYTWIAALLCVIGIGLISLNDDFSIGFGDVLSICCGLFFALQIVFINKFMQKSEAVQLLFIQLLTTALVLWICHFIVEMPKFGIIKVNMTQLWPVLYLAVFGTGLAQFFQMFGQKYTSDTEASLILTLESVFGAFFSGIFYHEKFTVQCIIGFVVVFLALVVSETKLSFLHLEKLSKNKSKQIENINESENNCNKE